MTAFVLMTAMPPTKGHLDLVRFAREATDYSQDVLVVLCTQPGEPFVTERFMAVCEWLDDLYKAKCINLYETMEQNAEAPGFWDMWKSILTKYGANSNDTFVASEMYGKKVADLFGAKFLPYDIGRQMNKAKGNDVRTNPFGNFYHIAHTFQPHLRRTVTFFGAESCGKTETSKHVSAILNGHWTFEYARPYLEALGPEITVDKMTDIWHGQCAVQDNAHHYAMDLPFIVQDTDLFSTVGFWKNWSPETMPDELVRQAKMRKSDLYIILGDAINFAPDQLRYGGDRRETNDQYWIDLCKEYGLNYKYVNSKSYVERESVSTLFAMENFYSNAAPLMSYERKHNG
jgi:NadR type nicotinamide-nucleotide adenylyltransferase